MVAKMVDLMVVQTFDELDDEKDRSKVAGRVGKMDEQMERIKVASKVVTKVVAMAEMKVATKVFA